MGWLGLWGRMISGPQYRKLMQTYHQTGSVTASALKSGMDRKTARKYIQAGQGPGEAARERGWRTRKDPFVEFWPEVEAWLSANPGMQARSAFEELQRRYPGRFEDRQLRSLQRRFKQWRLDHGVAVKAIYFAQEHQPGRLLQLDWFHPRDFAVTISGEAFRHLLCHCVLSFSNWEWVSVCHSESFSSLKTALQGALWDLGGVPSLCQVDNSSTATHRLSGQGQRRGFNERFLGLLAHYGMQPKTIQLGQANENGDVESAHSHLRRYLVDTLALRGSADFESIEAYEAWLREQLARRNASRALKLAQERELMAELPPVRLPEYEEQPCQVNKYGLVREIGRASCRERV